MLEGKYTTLDSHHTIHMPNVHSLAHSLAQAADDKIMLESGDPAAVFQVTDRNEVHMHRAGPICAQIRLEEAVARVRCPKLVLRKSCHLQRGSPVP